MRDHEVVIMETVRGLVHRRLGGEAQVALSSDMFDELGMDSLEVAELSAVLEETFGTDPYTEGLLARTPAEILSFYQSSPA